MIDAFSIFIIPPLLSLLFGVYLAVLALVSFRRVSLKGRVLFALVCIGYSLLSPVFICHHFIDDDRLILSIERTVHLFYVFLPVLVVAFFHHLLGIRRPAVLIVMAVLSCLFSVSTQSDWYITGLYKYGWGLIAKGGVAFQLFGLYGAVAMAYSVVSFVIRMKRENHPTLRLRFKYVIWSFGIATILTFFNTPAMHGVDLYPAGNFSFLPLALLAYGVFKHRLVEVRSLLHLSFLRAILYAMVFFPNLLLFLWLFPIIAKASEAVQFAFLSLWYLSNTFYVIPIRALAQRWLYKTRNELQQAEVSLMKEMLVLGDSGSLIRKVNDAVCRLLAFDRIEILTCDATERALILPDGTTFPLPESLYHHLRHRRSIFEATPGNMNVPVTATPATLLGLLAKLDAMYAIALEHNGNLIGLLALPQKHDQRPLYAEEAAFIENIAGTLSLALSNAIMYQRIASLKDHLQNQTEALTAEVEERQRAESSLTAAQRDLVEAHLAMENAVLQANEMTAKMEINNHVLIQEMEDRKKVEQALRKSEEMYRLIAENATDVIWTIDMEGRFTFISPSVRHLLGYTPQEMLALQIPSVLTPESLKIATQTIAEELARTRTPGAALKQSRAIELEQVRKNGTTVWTEVNTRFLMDERRSVVGILGVTRDITQRRHAEQELIYLAYHDGLTGLYNRKAFVEHLESEIRYADRYGSGLGLLFFDLNKFKQVNDTFGHEVGDRLLMGVAKRLLTIVRETDLVARLGGDEFTIILKNPDTVMPEVVARRTAEALARPYDIGEVVIDFVSASIGIAAFPKDGRSAGALMKSADLAMYRAKESNSHWVFCSTPPVQTL